MEMVKCTYGIYVSLRVLVDIILVALSRRAW